MIKKFIPFVCCLTPFCAMAQQDHPGTSGQATQIEGVLNATSESHVFQYGNGIDVDGAIVAPTGMYIGVVPADVPLPAGQIYAYDIDTDDPYTVTATGNISLGALQVALDSLSVVIGGGTGSPVNVGLGNIDATGALTVQNANAFTAGSINADNSLDISANTITTGAVDVESDGYFTANGAIAMTELVVHGSGSYANISGASLTINGTVPTYRDLQAYDHASIDVEVGTGTVSVAGAIENKSDGYISVIAGAVSALNITNESNDGSIDFTVASLTVDDGDVNATDASIVNSGDFSAEVSGATTLAHGFNLSGMAATNSFSLTTGTLSLGAGVDSFYTNNINSFYVELTDTTNGNIDTDSNFIRNGVGVGENDGNANAGMTVIAQNIDAGGVRNNATMNLTARGTMTIDGAFTNAGTLNAGANVFDLATVSNTGSATFNGTGAFSATGLTNSGTLLSVSGSTVDVSGAMSNTAGTMSVTSGDTVSAHNISVTGGTMNLTGAELTDDNIVVGESGRLNIYDVTAIDSSTVVVYDDLTVGTGTASNGGLNINTDGYVSMDGESVNVGGDLIVSGQGLSVDADTANIGGTVTVNNGGALYIGLAGQRTVSVDESVVVGQNSKAAIDTGYLGIGDDISVAQAGQLDLIIDSGNSLFADNVSVANGGTLYVSTGAAQDFNINSLNVYSLTILNAAPDSSTAVMGYGWADVDTGMNVWSWAENGAGVVPKDFILNANQSVSILGNATLQNGTFLNIITPSLQVTGTLTNNGDFDATIGGGSIGTISNATDKTLDITSTGAFTLTGGINNSGIATINGSTVGVGAVSVSGGSLVVSGTSSVTASSVNVTGGHADIDSAVININGGVNIGSGVMHQGVASSGALNLVASQFTANIGSLSVASFMSDGGIGTYDIAGTANFGNTIDVLDGSLVNFKTSSIAVNAIHTDGGIYQNRNGLGTDGHANVVANQFNLLANSVDVGGNISVSDFRITNNNGVIINVNGNVSGGLDIFGLKKMTIGGTYTFDDHSRFVAIADSQDSGGKYWATAEIIEEDGMRTGSIVNNLSDAEPMISIGNQLITNISTILPVEDTLQESQIGLLLHEVVDINSALWLMHVEDPLAGDDALHDLQLAITNLKVGFCNADGTQCLATYDDLYAYIVAWDNDENGVDDSLYVVFDDRWKDIHGLFKLQPVVGSIHHKNGEYVAAGVWDDLIEARLGVYGWNYNAPLEVVREYLLVGTPLENIGNELYGRMYDYAETGNAKVIRAFSRLFQLTEAHQIADSLAQNDHAVSRDLARRLIDESIWNRHRNLNKLWFDADFGMFSNKFDYNRGDGTRLSMSFGYDWQSSKHLILGWFGHAAYTESDNTDNIDLSYSGASGVTGRVDTSMDDLSIGGGMYFMGILNNKMRLYGDIMARADFIDVERTQTWISKVTGDTTSFGLGADLGLIHDWLNQYIIGNLYLRTGYNFGFDMNEKMGGADYMNLDFDGYFSLTPGYSLTAQKRIYPSAWFEMRPYATVGVEYDLFGTPGDLKYKFALAHAWRDYDVQVDPFWAYAGVGVQFLGLGDWQVSAGYQYQYNQDIQMHSIKLNGLVRF